MTIGMPRHSTFPFSLLAALFILAAGTVVRADDSSSSRHLTAYSSKHGVVRQYSLEDRVRYQLWNYTWKPDPNQAITRIEVRIGEQKVYVYQGDSIAGESPVTTGKPGHDTPTGHYSIIQKDIDHKSNLYGLITDANGNVVDDNAEAGQKVPAGLIYDAADMPYYMRIREDGTGLHAGYLPGHRPRTAAFAYRTPSPSCSSRTSLRARRLMSCSNKG